MRAVRGARRIRSSELQFAATEVRHILCRIGGGSVQCAFAGRKEEILWKTIL